MTAPIHSVTDVIARLDAIVDRARCDRSRAGYFAALYRNVTARVHHGIEHGRFEDGPRMARFDVIFASRYLDAADAYAAGRPLSRCWRIAFDATSRWPPLVLQHLLLGMNAHICMDLGIAAAEVAPGAALPGLRRDFLEINRLLVEMIDEVQGRLAAISPWMDILDHVGDRTDEALCGFCLERARDCAWEAAERLAVLDGPRRGDEIERLDRAATALSVPIRTPGPVARIARLGVRLVEPRDVVRVIDVLDGRRGTPLPS